MKLLPRKEFIITIDDKDYRGKLGTYAYKIFGLKRGVADLKDISNLLTEPKDEDVLDLIIAAIEYRAEIDRVKVELNTAIVYSWIDDGLLTWEQTIEIFNHAADEKTKNVNGESLPAGTISNGVSTQLEESPMSSGT